ncbi:hypothetical protein GW889_02820 [Candidatus Berkelbacteria bacterium]|nr:hypothetical protein [Candidatus Berkelbacteria bacterium]
MTISVALMTGFVVGFLVSHFARKAIKFVLFLAIVAILGYIAYSKFLR